MLAIGEALRQNAGMMKRPFLAALLCLLPLAATEIEESDLGTDEQRAYQPTEFFGDLSDGMPSFGTGGRWDSDYVPQGMVFHMSRTREGHAFPAEQRGGILRHFLKNGDVGCLAKHFARDKKELSAAPYLCRPAAPASDRCVLWRMKVQAPCAGTYRFLGVADGALAVSVKNGVPVLRAGSLLQQPPVVTGECFSVKMGEVFHVDVLVADGDTPQHGHALLIQEIREGALQKPVLFLLRETAMPDSSFLPMEAESDAEVWRVIP